MLRPFLLILETMLELFKGGFGNTAVLRDTDFDVSLPVVFIMADVLCISGQHQEMLLVNVSLRGGGVFFFFFTTFYKRAPDEAGMDTPDAVSRTAGAQTSSTRAPGEAGLVKWRPDVLHTAPDEAQQKGPSECKKYSTPSSNEGVKSIRCGKENGRRHKDCSRRNALWWFGLALGVPLVFAFFLVALSGSLVPLACLLSCSCVCWVLPGSSSCLFA